MPNKKAKKHSLTKEQKIELAETKNMISQEINEIKINKKITKQIEKKVIANPKLLAFSVVNAGIKNKFNEVEHEHFKILQKIDKLKIDSKNSPELLDEKKKLAKSKKNLDGQRKICNEEVREIKELNKKPKGSIEGWNGDNEIITVKNVNKIYVSKSVIFHALKDINFSIKKGTFNVILGPSGSGKTTLLNMISGLDHVTYGEVVVDGINIAALTTSQLTQFRRRQIGFIFQSYNLLASLNVSDNVEVGRALQTNAKKRRDIGVLLESIDMSDKATKKTYELSGGQQQRVSIARALAKSPNILIGDEPTGALDQKTSLKVFQLFQEINKTQNATVIIVTHNQNVAKLAHQVIHVKDGRIDKVVKNDKPLQASTLEEI